MEEILDLGPQPLCNRFIGAGAGDDQRYVIIIAVCSGCGLVQIPRSPPPDAIRPTVDWIGYREPESHLDATATVLARLPGVSTASAILGITQYDRPLLDRLRQVGFHRVGVLDARADLGIRELNAGTETVQCKLTMPTARRIAERRGRADVVVSRYLLEHAHSIRELLGALRELVTEDGHLLVEVPDCAPPLRSLDYSTLWEEHVLYFTLSTLGRCLDTIGFQPERAPVALGTDTLLTIARKTPRAGARERAAPEDDASEVRDEVQRARSFAAGLPETRRRWNSLLRAHARAGRSVVLCGAGHAGLVFVNILQLAQRIAFVIDDHPRKQGLLCPGSRLPIKPSEALVAEDVGICILAVGPDGEERVTRAQEPWVAAGGQFLSIYPQSTRHPFAGRE